MSKPGDRVVALRFMDDEAIHVLGRGVYQGRLHSPVVGFANPCIKLDDGRTVWGYQCWWGPESMIDDEEFVQGRTIKEGGE